MPSEPNAVSSGARRRSTRGQTSAISSGGVPAADQRQQLLADELERPARAGALEEANRAVESAAAALGVVGEQRALEVRERRRARHSA